MTVGKDHKYLRRLRDNVHISFIFKMADLKPFSFGSSSAPVLSQDYNDGRINLSEKYATYLKLFSGELFKAYQNATIARDLVTRRTLRNGKSMQFIFTGNLQAYYHTPGKQILGTTDEAGATANGLDVAEKTIICDDLLIASSFVDNLEEVFAHYDLRGEIARKIAHALANTYDKNIFKTVLKAAEEGPVTGKGESSPVSGQTGGHMITLGAGNATNAEKIVKAMYKAAVIFDENNVPDNGRVCVLPPEAYYNLITTVSQNIIHPVNRDEQGTAIQSGKGVYEIAGIRIVRSNNVGLGKFAHTRTNGENNSYDAATKTVACGMIFHKDSVGVVESVGPQVQTTSGDTRVMYQGDLVVGKVAMGAGTLNPAGAIGLLATDNTAAQLKGTSGLLETAGILETDIVAV